MSVFSRGTEYAMERFLDRWGTLATELTHLAKEARIYVREQREELERKNTAKSGPVEQEV